MASDPLSSVRAWAAGGGSSDTLPGGNWLTRVLERAGVSVQAAHNVSDIVLRPLEIVITVGLAVLIAHFGAKAIRRGLGRPAGRAAGRMDSPRAQARASTVVALVANLFRATVGVVAGLMVLGIMGINLTPILASATVIAATVAFGAQALVRDYLSGILLTVEDQFGLGDTVTVGDTTGVVEELTLRVTRLRAFDGTLWFVPNGDIRKLANQSRGWARAVVDVTVSPTAPGQLERMEDLLAETAAELLNGPRFAGRSTEPVQIVGVVDADATTCTLRVAVRTTPADRDPVQRALRLAILSALSAEGFWPPPDVTTGPGPDAQPA